MKKLHPPSQVSRRAFGAFALAGAVSTAALSEEKAKRRITSASVPEDPDAPGVQEGTVLEEQPFAEPLTFSRHPAPSKVMPFELSQVRLLPSPFVDAQEANRAMLHRLPADRLVHTFRLNASLPTSAEPLGGWEKPDGELRGHFTGHFLSGCALMYASTGDREVKAKGDEIVAALAQCQQKLPGGYLSAFPTEFFDRLKARKKVWAPFYTVHKIMAGMLDMHRYCGNQQALAVVSGMADWADRWTAGIPEDHMQMVLDTEYGGMNDVLYDLAAVTGEDRFAVVGDRFTKKRFFNPLALRRDELTGLHTNTHIPQVIGAARRYEISSDYRFHDVADTFWHNVVETRTYVTGGTSNNEGWLAGPNKLAAELRQGGRHQRVLLLLQHAETHSYVVWLERRSQSSSTTTNARSITIAWGPSMRPAESRSITSAWFLVRGAPSAPLTTRSGVVMAPELKNFRSLLTAFTSMTRTGFM